MTEGIFKSYDPLAYKVNDTSALNKGLVKAFKTNNRKKIQEIVNYGLPNTVDVFITINKHFHACILIVPANNNSIFEHMQLLSDDPFKVPHNLLCWRIDLRYEEIQLRTYKISIKFDLFQVFKKCIAKSFFIGRYENVRNNLCFQLAILQAAPHHYNAVLADCVEFAKEFCLCLLSYCSNSSSLETIVKANIKKATATGLSVEYLSRNFGLSGFLGNFLLGGTDVSSLLSGNPLFVAASVIFLLIYPAVISLFVLYMYASYILEMKS